MRQRQALSIMMSGANVFLTGAPGAGKTYVLNDFVKRAEAAGKRVAVTASTGIAASHLGGTTIHSWSGLGILDRLFPEDLERLGGTDRLIKRYNSTDILVIDEVSMLHGYRLDMLSELAKALRSNDKPFGGMQVILVGDLFQLPPVSRNTRELDFVHMSEAWRELDLKICYITEQHRQEAHDGLLDLLEAMRRGEVADYHHDMLRERLSVKPGSDVVTTRLYAHNIDVDAINERQLRALSAEMKAYTWMTKGSKQKVEQLAKGLLAPETLVLKEGAEVMFVANNFSEGFVNGSRGQVVGFTRGLPVVKLLNGRTVTVDMHSWSLSEDGKVRAEISQLPLRLAWAITIHKSQGMSLDAAEIDLSRAFTTGMGYVALSRVRSLDGLYLHGMNPTAMLMHPHMDEFDAILRHHSARLAETADDIEDVEIQPQAETQTVAVDPELFQKLKVWRLSRAKNDGVAPFMVAHDKTLQGVSVAKPSSTQQLLGLPGFGPRKVEQYGDDIIKIITTHIQDS
jgi:ATP-dependent exoDNAse (exonuclease V) alpha subunit